MASRDLADDEVLACPECDKTPVVTNSPGARNGDKFSKFRCPRCNAKFDEAKIRQDRGGPGIRNDSLAAKLEDADPGDLVTDGGVDQDDVEIDAGALASDVAELSASRARKAAEYNRNARDEPVRLDRDPGELTQYQQWAVIEEAAMRAFANVIAMVQPEDKYGTNTRHVDGGRVKVRQLLRELSRRCDETNERRNGYDINSLQAGEAHSAYSKVISLIRNEYAVGWPRLDDISGTPIPEDQP